MRISPNQNQNQHPSKKKNENSDWYGKSRKATNSVGVYRIGTFLPSQDLPEDPSNWFHLFSKRYVKLQSLSENLWLATQEQDEIQSNSISTVYTTSRNVDKEAVSVSVYSADRSFLI